MQQVNPFELTTIEFEQWLTEQDRKQQEILSLLNHCQYKGTVIPSLWRVDSHSFYIVSQSAKKANVVQLTLFRNNAPIFDMLRSDFTDIAEELFLNNATVEQINYIN